MASCSKETQCDMYMEIFSENNALAKKDTTGIEKNRSMLLKQASLMEEFEQEKEEMVAKFGREKTALKKAYENERKEYEAEIDKLRKIIEFKMSEIESKYEEEFKKKEDKRRIMFEMERKNLKHSVQEQMDLIAEVESEIKRILKRLIIELKKYEPSKCSMLENDLCSKKINESCVMWLKEIFNENSNESCINFVENNEKKEKFGTREDELFEVGEAFRKQKKELTDIFMKEKKHLEEEIKSNCLEYKKKLDREYEERVKTEMKVWQETIKEYEREIGILRFEREQMDRNYCLEIDKMKLETEKEKVEICAKHMKEREQLRRALSDTVMNTLIQKKKIHEIGNDFDKGN